MDETDRDDPVLRDVGPYCSDPVFVKEELKAARSAKDAVRYIEIRIEEEEGSRRGDLRILFNRLTRKVK